jgi:TonB-dependent receptor
MKKIVALILLALTLFAAQEGDLSLYLLKDGKPLSSQTIEIYAQSEQKNTLVKTLFSDSDGFAHANLTQGKYQLQIVALEGDTPLVFARKNFLIKAGEESQLILALSQNDTLSFEDSEAPKLEEKKSVQKLVLENGVVTLSILSSEDNKPIKGARVFVKGQDIELVSDAKGQVNIKAPAGNQTLSIIHNDFSAQTLPLVFEANKTILKEISLSPASMELEEFVVLAPHVSGSISSMIEEKRNDLSVSEVMGSEQMSKSGDSKASDALKRVTGVTLVDGKYVFVRGLGERYTSVTLNGFYLPSPDPTRRVVPLDIFPTGVLDSIKVQKTAQANKNSEFAGGLVELRTKSIPDDFFFKLSVSSTYDDESTLKEGDTYDGGGLDFLGFDDGTRALPQAVLDATAGEKRLGDSTRAEITQISKQMSYQNNTYKKRFMPNYDFSISLGDSFDLEGDNKLGYYASTAYKYSNDITNFERNFFAAGGVWTASDDYIVSQQGYSLSSMFGLGYSAGKDHTISWNNLYLHQADDIVRRSHLINSNDRRLITSLSWQEQTLFTSQLLGEHKFDQHELHWRVAYSQAMLDEPDRRTYGFMYDNPGEPIYLSLFNSEKLARMYNTLVDDSVDSGLDYTMPIPSWINEENKLHVGVGALHKDRDSNFRTFNYRQSTGNSRIYNTNIDEIINKNTIGFSREEDQFYLNEVPLTTGNYTAKQQLYTSYAMADIGLREDISLNLGFRYEHSKQVLNIFNNQTGQEFVDGAAENITKDLLPSLLLTYKLNDEMQVRFGYSKTMSRPNFKELSEVIVLDPNTLNPYIGNKNLKSATIDNLDIRYEWYFSSKESFSIAGFAKDFTRPIEDVTLPSSDGELFSYANANGAFNYGFEIDLLKNFGQWQSIDLSDYFVGSNFSYIISEVDVVGMTVEDGGFLTHAKRPMQGQSPYVFNFSTGYDNQESGVSATVLYNIFGERIARVGTNSREDQMEQPVGRLDFVLLADIIENLKFSFKAQNLLNPVHRITQGDETAFEYTTGRRFSVGLSYKY